MGQLQANIKTIGELDFSLFDIPFYQRPYRWQPSHVETPKLHTGKSEQQKRRIQDRKYYHTSLYRFRKDGGSRWPAKIDNIVPSFHVH